MDLNTGGARSNTDDHVSEDVVFAHGRHRGNIIEPSPDVGVLPNVGKILNRRLRIMPALPD